MRLQGSVRSRFPDGLGLIEASNRQVVGVLRAEAETPDALLRMEDRISKVSNAARRLVTSAGLVGSHSAFLRAWDLG